VSRDRENRISMAETSDPNPISPTPSVEPKGGHDTEQQRPRAEKDGDSAPDDAPGREFGDQASILGIPEAELTPKVQAAMSALMSRAARLMEEAEQLREQAAYLEDVSDQDPLLPILNRRALLRELAQALTQAEQTETTSSFLYLDVVNADDTKRRLGRAAAEALLVHAASTAARALRTSDVIGSLGGYDFGVVLALAKGDAAADKAGELVAILEATPLRWREHTVALKIAWALHEFGPSESVDDVLTAAEPARPAKANIRERERDQ
jgi:diguanylate cyclase (GGDEF)-like protein